MHLKAQKECLTVYLGTSATGTEMSLFLNLFTYLKYIIIIENTSSPCKIVRKKILLGGINVLNGISCYFFLESQCISKISIAGLFSVNMC